MLSRSSLLFSPTRDGVPSSDDNFTVADLCAAQDALENEARDALPFRFDSCTFDLGHIKQPVYSCRTCLNDSGICAGCSIACHGEHELVELFCRRDFRCDCGTERMGAGSCCSLTGRDDAPRNADNKYDKNFRGVFCICGVAYDPHTETDSMVQCLVCEDWLHHACLFGFHSETGESPLGSDDFDMLVCERCVKGNIRARKLLERYAGVEGTGVMLVRKENEVLGRATIEDDDDEAEEMAETQEESVASASAAAGEKRKVDDDLASIPSDEPSTKKAKHLSDPSSSAKSASTSSTSSASVSASLSASLSTTTSLATTAPSSQPSTSTSSCRAPPVLANGTSPLAQLERESGRCNVYLEEGWMERWCRCDECNPLFDGFPYFLDEEEAYEPPEDTDPHKSTMELGMDALLNMPRAQAIEGALAFQGLSERLKAFLRPHADAGKTITKELVEEFFAMEKDRR